MPPLDPPPSQTTAQLLERARQGSAVAVGRLLEAARGYLLIEADEHLPRDLRAKVGPSDIVQETAIDAHRDFQRFRGTTKEEFYAWLRAILQNNVTDAVRRFELTQKRATGREERLAVVVDRYGVSVLHASGPQPDHSAIRREDAAFLTDVLARIPEDYRAVLRLRYWEGLTFPQIALRLGRSEDASRKLWYRALARLNEELRSVRPARPSVSSTQTHA